MECRKNYFIDREFQGRFIIKFCLLAMLGTLVSGTLLYLFARSTVTTSFENSRLVLKSTADFMLPMILLSGGAVIVVTGIVTIFITLFTSHKIAGPLYRLEKDIAVLKEGDLTVKFRLRQGDQLERLREGLDGLSVELKGRLSGIKGAVADMDALLNEPGMSADARQGAIREKIGRMSALLSKFTT
jgi:methyl-accepting chemotaxis protein